jgi:hypothetical protein
MRTISTLIGAAATLLLLMHLSVMRDGELYEVTSGFEP